MNWFFAGLALVLILWFFALFYLRGLVRRRTNPSHILTLLQEEVRQLEADIDEKTEQSLLLLEEKIGVLRELTAGVEQKIGIFSRELERRKGEAEVFTALGRGIAGPEAVSGPPDPVEAVNTPRSRRKTPARKAGKPEGRAGASSPGVFPDLSGAETREPPRPLLKGLEVKETAADSAYRAQTGQPRIRVSPEPLVPKPSPLKDRIAELYRAGFSPDLIAERLGLSLGETKLYIAMVDRG
ncbi:MAG: hypothetical protein LBD31_01075 [Treponema sp.]|jgi:hypothetical protein|nr:hypothetical protein [Treponema sp.]